MTLIKKRHTIKGNFCSLCDVKFRDFFKIQFFNDHDVKYLCYRCFKKFSTDIDIYIKDNLGCNHTSSHYIDYEVNDDGTIKAFCKECGFDIDKQYLIEAFKEKTEYADEVNLKRQEAIHKNEYYLKTITAYSKKLSDYSDEILKLKKQLAKNQNKEDKKCEYGLPNCNCYRCLPCKQGLCEHEKV